MRYKVLACDYDGTLADAGRVSSDTIHALETLRQAGGRTVLITGRQIEDLLHHFPSATIFDRVVAENGALLYQPSTQRMKLLAKPVPPVLMTELRGLGVAPLSRGHIIIATLEPFGETVRAAIDRLGIPAEVALNKGAVMVLPKGIDKATGMRAALEELGVSSNDTVGVGDAENDQAFLRACGFSVAVNNALLVVKDEADFVTHSPSGDGVVELIGKMLQQGHDQEIM